MRKIVLLALIACLAFTANAQAAKKAGKSQKAAIAKIAKVAKQQKKIVARAVDIARTVRESGCRYALDSLLKIEISQVPENAAKLKELMDAARSKKEYDALVQSCLQDLSQADLQCMTAARSVKDIENCDK